MEREKKTHLSVDVKCVVNIRSPQPFCPPQRTLVVQHRAQHGFRVGKYPLGPGNTVATAHGVW